MHIPVHANLCAGNIKAMECQGVELNHRILAVMSCVLDLRLAWRRKSPVVKRTHVDGQGCSGCIICRFFYVKILQ